MYKQVDILGTPYKVCEATGTLKGGGENMQFVQWIKSKMPQPLTYKWYGQFCPKCKRNLLGETYGSFCPYCGQKLKRQGR